MTSDQIRILMEKFRDRFGARGTCGVYFPKLDADEVIDFLRAELKQEKGGNNGTDTES